MILVRVCQNIFYKTVLNSATPKTFVSAQSALEQKNQKSHLVHLTQISFETLCEYEGQ